MSGAVPWTASNTPAFARYLRRRPSQAADQPGTQIGDDVAVQILQEQHVELFRPDHELHAGGVDDLFVVVDLRIMGRTASSAPQEEPIATSS